MILLSLLRALFFIYNFNFFETLTFHEVIYSFFHGLRFDFYCVCLAIIPLILSSQFFYSNHTFCKLSLKYSKTWFLLSISLFTFAIVADIEYFTFTTKHITKNILDIGNDLNDQWLNLLTQYFPVSLLTAFVAFLFYKFFPRYSLDTFKRKELPLRLSVGKVADLTLNSAFTFIRSKRIPRLPSAFLKDPRTSFSKKHELSTHFERPKKKQNIVFIILESFALEYLNLDNNQASNAPYLMEIAEKGAFFKKFFSNGRTSIDLGPSILCGLPNLAGAPLIITPYQSNNLECLPEKLSELNYQTSFFHGTKRNSMYFDSFAFKSGIQQYFGLEDYPTKKDYNGVWGIFDEEYLQYSAKEISKFKSPFFSVVFTLSSHPPYVIPEKHSDKFSDGSLKVHKSIQYADFALKRFFETIRKEDWYKDTLFILTADHAYKSDQIKFQDEVGYFRVPLILFHPSMDLSWVNTNRIGHHVDLKASILDFIGEAPNTVFGESIFKSEDGGSAYNLRGEGIWYLDQEAFLTVRKDGSTSAVYSHKNTWNHKEEDKDSYQGKSDFFIESILKPYFTGLKQNSWYSKNN